MSEKLTFFCHSCGTGQLFISGYKVSKSDECEKCRNDLRVCLNCEFYDKQRNRECREHIQEPIIEKSKRNSCDFFKVKLVNNLNSSSPVTEQNKTQRELAEALFKKK